MREQAGDTCRAKLLGSEAARVKHGCEGQTMGLGVLVMRRKRTAAEHQIQPGQGEKGQGSERNHKAGLSRLCIDPNKQPCPS